MTAAGRYCRDGIVWDLHQVLIRTQRVKRLMENDACQIMSKHGKCRAYFRRFSGFNKNQSS